MLRVSSWRFPASVEIAALLLFTSMAAFGQSTSGQSLSGQTSSGQSLGDLARENQAKKAAEASAATPPKVITNADLPENPDGDTGQPANRNQNSTTSPASAKASRKAAQQRAAEQRAAAQWRQQILAQKNVIANLQAQVDQLKASIHFVDPAYSAYSGQYDYYAGLGYNRGQAWQLQRLHQMELQLGQQKRKLDDMQEAARHAGMHTAVYDP
jgi:hypothetical protein